MLFAVKVRRLLFQWSMRTILLIAALPVILHSACLHSATFEGEEIETHIGGGGVFYVPIHHKAVGFGYGFSLTMRPSYARYLFDELERWHFGISIQSQVQQITENDAFRDYCFTLRYYLNRGKFGPHWESAFIGAGCGVATVFWETKYSSGSRKDIDYIAEAGYEFDLRDRLVLMFNVTYRIVDIEPVSFTGAGISLNLCYGVHD
jgi:hypothetical protein